MYQIIKISKKGFRNNLFFISKVKKLLVKAIALQFYLILKKLSIKNYGTISIVNYEY